MKIWCRYFSRELLKTFFFFLASLFFLYVLINLSSKGVRFFSHKTTSFTQVGLYYLQDFATHLDLFCPLAFLLATLKVLSDLNKHRELISLQMAGLSQKKLLLPFFLFASALSFLLYANSQWFIPTSLSSARHFKTTHSKKNRIHPNNVHHFSLEDHSEVVYQSFHEESKLLRDVFWIKKPDDLWHMKSLQIDTAPPQGFFVDHFQKTALGLTEKVESFDQYSFPDIRWSGEEKQQRLGLFEGRSLQTLFAQAFIRNAEQSKVRAHLYYKLLLPWLSFLLLLGLAPFSMRFSRSTGPFLLTALSLAVFIASITLIDGMLILGENHTLAPSLAIFGPFILIFLGVFRRFLRDC